jgi:hypothetical protein
MDDIQEKLSLLDYETQFCKGWKIPRKINRVYFSHSETEHDGNKQEEVAREKVQYFYNLTYWLMSLNKDKVIYNT